MPNNELETQRYELETQRYELETPRYEFDGQMYIIKLINILNFAEFSFRIKTLSFHRKIWFPPN